MDTYIGTKIIKAEPQACQKDYHKSKVGDPGFKVEYEDGYTSWSPKKAFEDAYIKMNGLNFGLAIEAMRKGHKVARAGWNGKGMFIAIQKGSVISRGKARGGVAKFLADDGLEDIIISAHIDMKAADGSVVVGWLASQTDMLATDWSIIE